MEQKNSSCLQMNSFVHGKSLHHLKLLNWKSTCSLVYKFLLMWTLKNIDPLENNLVLKYLMYCIGKVWILCTASYYNCITKITGLQPFWGRCPVSSWRKASKLQTQLESQHRHVPNPAPADCAHHFLSTNEKCLHNMKQLYTAPVMVFTQH